MLSRVESGYWNGGSPPFGYDLRYESPRKDGGTFLFVLRFQADGSKLVLDESGEGVRTLARGERLQVSKRDRSRLVLSSPERVDLVRRIFTMSAVNRMGYRAIANVLNEEGVPSPQNAEWAHIYSGAWTPGSPRIGAVVPARSASSAPRPVSATASGAPKSGNLRGATTGLGQPVSRASWGANSAGPLDPFTTGSATQRRPDPPSRPEAKRTQPGSGQVLS